MVLTKGLLGADGELPSTAVRKSTPKSPVACLGGPAHALEAVQRGASVTVASKDREFSALIAGALRTAGLSCHTSTDLVGVELAGVAKNAAALAAGAALEELESAEVSLLGRVTYDGFSAAWPERGGQGDPFAVFRQDSQRHNRRSLCLTVFRFLLVESCARGQN